MLATNRAVYDCGSGFNRNSTRCSRSDCAINYRESRPVLVNVFQHLLNELVALKREADMHDIASRDRRRQIDVNTECLIPALQDRQQRFADLSKTEDDDSLLHRFRIQKADCLDSAPITERPQSSAIRPLTSCDLFWLPLRSCRLVREEARDAFHSVTNHFISYLWIDR